MIEYAALLLPLAAASGWFFASKYYGPNESISKIDQTVYFQGLNYLLNEKTDKAIDVFIDLLEVDNETVGVHMALGSLFRKQGEVEKAIRLHQNLIARPELDPRTRFEILNELGMDYMNAGLLDRAETLFLELEKNKYPKKNHIKQLLSIYQQEKEWDKAIEYANKFEDLGHQKKGILLAQLNCELAEEAVSDNNLTAARSYLKKALKLNSLCVRASTLSAVLCMKEGQYKLALKFWEEVKNQNISFVPVYIDSVLSCFDKLGMKKEKLNFLSKIVNKFESPVLTQHFILLLKEQNGYDQAYSYAKEKLLLQPDLNNLSMFANISNRHHVDNDLNLLLDLFSKLHQNKIAYHCTNCGFDSDSLHWCCPSCKSWDTVKTVIH